VPLKLIFGVEPTHKRISGEVAQIHLTRHRCFRQKLRERAFNNPAYPYQQPIGGQIRSSSTKWNSGFHFWEYGAILMIVIGTDIAETYFKSRAGHRGIKAARAQYDAWLAIAETADWKTPEDVKKAHPKASVLKGGRVVFNIKANDFRLIALVQYMDSILMIRFFGSHEEYDSIDAGTV
jgi:mRNA interferase HigB